MPATYVDARASRFRTRVRFPAPPPLLAAGSRKPLRRSSPCLDCASLRSVKVDSRRLHHHSAYFWLFRDLPGTVAPTVSPADGAPTATERPPSPRDRTSIEMPSSFALGGRCMYRMVAAKDRWRASSRDGLRGDAGSSRGLANVRRVDGMRPVSGKPCAALGTHDPEASPAWGELACIGRVEDAAPAKVTARLERLEQDAACTGRASHRVLDLVHVPTHSSSRRIGAV